MNYTQRIQRRINNLQELQEELAASPNPERKLEILRTIQQYSQYMADLSEALLEELQKG